MADAPKLLGTDTLRTAYPKINQAIDNANEALSRSQNAENIASNAENFADQAVQTANNVQEQLNQIVIEGDSSVEAAQARVDAEGNVFTTLKERLDTKEQQFTERLTATINSIGESIELYPLIAPEIDDTGRFKRAAASGKRIIVPNLGTPYVISEEINLSNSVIGVGMPEIKMNNATGDGSRCMFRITGYDGDGLHICGLILDGQYDNRYDNYKTWSANTSYEVGDIIFNNNNGRFYKCIVAGTTGNTPPTHTNGAYVDGEVTWEFIATEFDHNISVEGSKNVYIYDNVLKNPFGDNVFVGALPERTSLSYSENIHIFNNQMINPRRCNVAVVSGVKVYIKRNIISKANDYVASIDIEPDLDSTEIVNDVNITKNDFNVNSVFINLSNPNADIPIENVYIENNKGQSNIFVRFSSTWVGKCKNLTITKNQHYGNIGFARFCNISNIIGRLEVSGNYDFTNKGSDGISFIINNITNPIVVDNTVDSPKNYAFIFYDCNYIEFKRNTGKNITGYFLYLSSNASPKAVSLGHQIVNNLTINVGYGIVFDQQINGALVDGNVINSNTRGLAVLHPGSLITITDTNKFTGSGYGVGYSNNLVVKESYLATGRTTLSNLYGTSAPSSSENWYDVGAIVWNLQPVETGNAGSKYLVLGWVCVSAGNPGSWREIRVLTGN